MWKHIPNLVSLIRVVLVAPVVVLVSLGYAYRIPATLVYALATLTDPLDGYLARRWKLESKLGEQLDTLGDKLLIVMTLMALLSVDGVWLWIAVLIVSREVGLLVMRILATEQGIAVPPSKADKRIAAFKFFAIGTAVLRVNWSVWVMVAATGLTLYTMSKYLREYFRQLKHKASMPK